MRLLFIDNIRWSIIILVLSMHASDTYSPFGNWYYTDRPALSVGERVFFATYQSWLQSFFMALLFFLAAYFTPASYDRKGAAQYVRDRLIRLILPTLFYIFVIGPLTEFYLSRSWTGGGGFVHQWVVHIIDGEWISGTGPMWFCVVLFGFSLIYACARVATDPFRPGSSFAAASAPSPGVSLTFIFAMAIGSFVVRLFQRSGTSILNIHPADLPQYALMFTAGILAGPARWFERSLPAAMVRTSLSALAAAAAIWIYIIARVVTHSDEAGQLNGGLNLLSALRCLWEALACVGISYLLIALFRRYFNQQGPLARFLSENAFCVYLFHPPIIIACAILLHAIALPGPWKAALLTVIAGIVTFCLSQLVFRRIPYLRAVL